jgi:hypothetical protein
LFIIDTLEFLATMAASVAAWEVCVNDRFASIRAEDPHFPARYLKTNRYRYLIGRVFAVAAGGIYPGGRLQVINTRRQNDADPVARCGEHFLEFGGRRHFHCLKPAS